MTDADRVEELRRTLKRIEHVALGVSAAQTVNATLVFNINERDVPWTAAVEVEVDGGKLEFSAERFGAGRACDALLEAVEAWANAQGST